MDHVRRDQSLGVLRPDQVEVMMKLADYKHTDYDKNKRLVLMGHNID